MGGSIHNPTDVPNAPADNKQAVIRQNEAWYCRLVSKNSVTANSQVNKRQHNMRVHWRGSHYCQRRGLMISDVCRLSCGSCAQAFICPGLAPPTGQEVFLPIHGYSKSGFSLMSTCKLFKKSSNVTTIRAKPALESTAKSDRSTCFPDNHTGESGPRSNRSLLCPAWADGDVF